MTHYNFDFNNETWGTADFQWTGAEGSPSLGCMYAAGTATPLSNPLSTISSVSIPVTAGDACSFKVRITTDAWTGYGAALVTSPVTITCFSAGLDDSTGDTGWVLISGTANASGTITSITANIGSGILGSHITGAWFDSVYVAESPPTGPVAVRYLGMTADNVNLYVTSIQGGTLTLEYSALTSPGTILDTFTFGTAAYTDPDTYSRGIWPVAVSDNELYLYGRDGNNIQAQYNDLNGTAGWVDVGAGTATWATTKFCVALMPQPVAPRNLIAAFADDDIYSTILGTGGGWAKQGDAGTALRTASRVTTTFHQLLVAGQGTAQTYYSQNYGASFGNAYSGLAGTVNGIEVSR